MHLLRVGKYERTFAEASDFPGFAVVVHTKSLIVTIVVSFIQEARSNIDLAVQIVLRGSEL